MPSTTTEAPKPTVHGGDLGEAATHFPAAPRPWIDLSTGINPQPYPVPPLPDNAWSRLPSRAMEEELQQAAADRYGVADPRTIVAAPGTQALIQLLPRLVPKGRVAILGPTYQEHQLCWARHGHEVRVVPTLEDSDVVVVVNPNNPTGRLIPPADLAAIKGLLIVDEAFIDFLPREMSLAGDRPERAIVLRSFGKTYGLPGLRLGFAIASRAFAGRLREEFGPWSVSGAALMVGRRALRDGGWLRAARERLVADNARLDGLLRQAGFELLGGTLLFRLVRHASAGIFVQRLGQQGIHVRAFPEAPEQLRFGLPANDTAFRRLAAALGV
ncbi:MAG TPA: threonine-phosphate decarboxylase CobD [Acetobacteraceae bacterium]|nr:threonine-phosphate decarboxylase CobD [Acetobacteraceae bacterium]